MTTNKQTLYKKLVIGNFGFIIITLLLAMIFGFMIGIPSIKPGDYYFFPTNPQTGQWFSPTLQYGFWSYRASFQYIGENGSFGNLIDIGNGWGLGGVAYHMSVGGILTTVILFVTMIITLITTCIVKFNLGKYAICGLGFALLVAFITVLAICLHQYNQLPFLNL